MLVLTFVNILMTVTVGTADPSWTADVQNRRWCTVRNILVAEVFTLPASIVIAFVLYVVLRKIL